MSGGLLADLPGLSLIAFDATSIATIFILGTLPAARAAKKDPVEALRYE